MGIDLTVGDKVYVHTKGTVMTVEDIILPGDQHRTSINWADVDHGGEFVVLKLARQLDDYRETLTVTANEVSIW